MSGWKEVLLTNYYDISSGLSKSASEFGKGFPFLSFKDVFWNYFVPNELTSLVNSNEKEQRSCSVNHGDIFLTRTSEKAEELGLSCVALKDYPNATFNGFTKRLRPKLKNEIDPVFIGFYLRSPKFRNEVSAYSNLITRASLNNGAINRLKIYIPEYKTQQRIGSILLRYNDLIENNLNRIKLLEELGQRTYEEWFVKFRVNGEALAINEETRLPEGWERKSADELFKIKIGKTPPREQEEWFRKDNIGVKWASIKDINNASVFIHETSERITHKGVDKFNMNLALKGTVILSFKLTVGKVTILTEDMVTNEAIAHFNVPPNSKFSCEYIYCYLKNFNYNTLGSTSSIGTALNSKIVKAMPFIVPNENIIDGFQNLTKPIFSLMENLLSQNRHLSQSRDILLPRLMNGTITVEQAEENFSMAAEPEVVYQTVNTVS